MLMARYHGLIEYLTPAATPTPSPYAQYRPYAAAKAYAVEVAAGDVASVYLNGYKSYDDVTIDHSEVSRSTGGEVTTLYFNEEIIKRFTVRNVEQVRGDGLIGQYEVYRALRSALARGVPATFYPDVDNFPDEYISVVAKKLGDPVRVAGLQLFDFTMELRELPSNTYPSTLPQFV